MFEIDIDSLSEKKTKAIKFILFFLKKKKLFETIQIKINLLTCKLYENYKNTNFCYLYRHTSSSLVCIYFYFLIHFTLYST